MNVKVVRGDGAARRVTLEFSAEEVSRQWEKVAREIAKKVDIPGGYHKPQAKLARVRQMFRKNIAAQVGVDLVQEHFQKALEENGLQQIGEPELADLPTAEPDRPLACVLDLEAMPTREELAWKGLIAPVVPVEVTDQDVDDAVETVRKEHAQLVPDAGPITPDHVVELQVTPQVVDDAVRVALTPVSIRPLEVRHILFAPLRDALAGRPAGGTFTLTAKPGDLPIGIHDPVHENREFVWQIEVKKASRSVVPPADDALAGQARGLKSLLALRGELREELRTQKEDGAREVVRRALFEQLLEKNVRLLPKRFVAGVVGQQIAMMDEAIARQSAGADDGDQTAQFYRSFMREQVSRRAMSEAIETFLVMAVFRNEGLEVTEQEIEDAVAADAQKAGLAPAFLKGKMKEEERDKLTYRLRTEKALALIAAAAGKQPVDEYVRERQANRAMRALTARHRALVRPVARRRMRQAAAR